MKKIAVLGLLFSLCVCKPIQRSSSSMNDNTETDFATSEYHSVPKTCPPQPVPQQLPTELPEGISKGFKALSDLSYQSIDNIAVPGMVVSVTYMNDAIFTRGFGVISKANPKLGPPNEKNIFRIGSISKIFPVLMVYQLLMNNKIDSLDDPITKYSPNFTMINPFSKDGISRITIRQMASQLSGLQREPPCSNRTVDHLCPQTNEEMLKLLSSEILIEPPLTRPSYSNLAYALLGRLLVDQYSKGMSFEEYVKTEILDPLNMTDTGFDFSDKIKNKLAIGYNNDGSEATLVNLDWVSPAGQMYSSIEDLNKLAAFFYQANLLPNFDEDVLSSILRREMSLPLFVNPDRETGFGTPWEILYRGNYTIRTKGGNINGT